MGMSRVYGFVQQSAGRNRAAQQRRSWHDGFDVLPLHRGDAIPAGQESVDPSAASAISLRGRRGLALLVEDDPGVRQLLRRELLDIGFSVMEAENGVEAIELINHIQGLQLLLSDVVMPGMSMAWRSAHARAKSGIPSDHPDERIRSQWCHAGRSAFPAETVLAR